MEDHAYEYTVNFLCRARRGEILLCDEPTGALDSKTIKEIMVIFEKLNREEKKTLENIRSLCLVVPFFYRHLLRFVA